MLHKISAKSQILMDQRYRGSQKKRNNFSEIPDCPIWGVTGPLQACQGACCLSILHRPGRGYRFVWLYPSNCAAACAFLSRGILQPDFLVPWDTWAARWALSRWSTRILLLLLQLPKVRVEICKFERIFFRFCKFQSISENFADFWKLPVISRTSDQIPRKFRWEITDFRRFQQHSAKIQKTHQDLANFSTKSANFECGAVQRYVCPVDLEECF